MNDYFKKKYFENKDYYKNKGDNDNPWDLTRKLYTQHEERKDKMAEDYVIFHANTPNAYYEHKDNIKFSEDRHIVFKVLYDFKYLILLGFVMFNLMIVGNFVITNNQDKTKVQQNEVVKQGKGLKTKILPLNTA